jgi:uncharacterized protein
MREGKRPPSEIFIETFMTLSRYCKIYRHPEDKGLRTLFSTSTMATVDVAHEVAQAIEYNCLSKRKRKTLEGLGFLVKSAEAEQRELLGFIENFNVRTTSFSAIVVLNLDCNLACTYCFEGKRKGKFYMSAEMADHFVDFIRSRDLEGKDEINVVFYGGEPLLGMDLILRISKKLKAFAKNKKLKYSFSFITNGTLLTRRVVEKLKPLGLKAAGVTLDGPREMHDFFRPFKTGKGSFDVIIKNIQDICCLIDVQVGGNYTKDYYWEFPRLLDHFVEKGISPDKISSVDFNPVINERNEFAPPDFHDGCMSTNEPWLSEATVFLREETLKRGFHTRELMPTVCAIERPNSIIVNYDGTLYKCPGLLGRKDFCVGDLTNGVIDYSASHALDNWKNEKCLSCSYLPLCFGGCRYMKLVRDGHMQGVDCKKQYLDVILEELVLQDITYDL